MEIPEELAEAAHKHQVAAGRNAAVDDLTTAIITGASPAEISRLEAAAANSPHDDDDDDGARPGGGQGYDQGDPNAGQPAGELPPDERRNAERIRLTGLEERDKGLVNAANIIARTERIPFDEAWQRVNGVVPGKHGGSSQAQAGNEEQGLQQAQRDGSAHDEADADEALRQHHLHMAGELYSDLRNPDSEHWREANRIATDPSHPDHDPELLARPHASLIIAKLAAANLGMRGAGAAGRGPVFQPGSHARPAAATKQSSPPPPGKTKAEIVRESEQAVLDAIEGRVPPPTRQAERAYLRL